MEKIPKYTNHSLRGRRRGLLLMEVWPQGVSPSDDDEVWPLCISPNHNDGGVATVYQSW